MTNKFCCFFLSMALLVAVPGLLSAPSSTETYTDSELGFFIEYPSSWRKTEVQGGNIVVLFTGGAINRNLQVMYDEGGEEGGLTALERLAAILVSQEEILAEWKEIHGRRAFYQEVEWTSILGANRAIRLLIPVNGHFFLVMSVCPAAEYDDLRPLMESCVLSFKLKE